MPGTDAAGGCTGIESRDRGRSDACGGGRCTCPRCFRSTAKPRSVLLVSVHPTCSIGSQRRSRRWCTHLRSTLRMTGRSGSRLDGPRSTKRSVGGSTAPGCTCSWGTFSAGTQGAECPGAHLSGSRSTWRGVCLRAKRARMADGSRGSARRSGRPRGCSWAVCVPGARAALRRWALNRACTACMKPDPIGGCSRRRFTLRSRAATGPRASGRSSRRCRVRVLRWWLPMVGISRSPRCVACNWRRSLRRKTEPVRTCVRV